MVLKGSECGPAAKVTNGGLMVLDKHSASYISANRREPKHGDNAKSSHLDCSVPVKLKARLLLWVAG